MPGGETLIVLSISAGIKKASQDEFVLLLLGSLRNHLEGPVGFLH